mmetsp:Transcript_23655/g.66808  ORF Transcript_23655/g.66808 Transcript_23655/m.66808 type:complete len:205 (+) Transcript_23655:1988-2602(+)
MMCTIRCCCGCCDWWEQHYCCCCSCCCCRHCCHQNHNHPQTTQVRCHQMIQKEYDLTFLFAVVVVRCAPLLDLLSFWHLPSDDHCTGSTVLPYCYHRHHRQWTCGDDSCRISSIYHAARRLTSRRWHRPRMMIAPSSSPRSTCPCCCGSLSPTYCWISAKHLPLPTWWRTAIAPAAFPWHPALPAPCRCRSLPTRMCRNCAWAH